MKGSSRKSCDDRPVRRVAIVGGASMKGSSRKSCDDLPLLQREGRADASMKGSSRKSCDVTSGDRNDNACWPVPQ